MEVSRAAGAPKKNPVMKSLVSIVRCASYDAEPLAGAVRRSLDLVGGLNSFLAPGMSVFVKINNLAPQAPPERAVCTHPLLFARSCASFWTIVSGPLWATTSVFTGGTGF